MAVTLVESAKLSQDKLQKGVIETFIQQSVILDRLPLLPIEGNAYAYNEEATLPGVAWRGVNESFTESTGTVNPKSERLYILGGDADVDTFIQQTRSNINDQRASQTKMKVKSLTYAFQDAFINGDSTVDGKQIDGLKKRLINAQIISAGTNGLGIITGAHDFLDKIDDLFAAVEGGRPDALYMNSFVKAKFRSIVRRLGGWHSYQEAETGKMIDSYNGVPLLDIGSKADGTTLILPQNETKGSSSDCSSIYAVKFGEGEEDRCITGLSNGGIQVKDLGELQEKSAYRTRIQAFLGLANFGGKGAARLEGVRLT